MNIEDHLHQRHPYLWVSEVLEHHLSEVKTRTDFESGHPLLKAHFPNASVVPGAILQECCTQSAAILLSLHHTPEEEKKDTAMGVLMHVHDAKYRKMLKVPCSCLTEVQLISRAKNAFRFKGMVKDVDGGMCAKLSFTLANLPMEAITDR